MQTHPEAGHYQRKMRIVETGETFKIFESVKIKIGHKAETQTLTKMMDYRHKE